MEPRKAQTVELHASMRERTYSLEEGGVVALEIESIGTSLQLTVQYRSGAVHLISHRGDYTIWWAE